MYYIFIKCPFLVNGENIVVIRAVPESDIGSIPSYIKKHHDTFIKKVTDARPTKEYETDPKYKDYYPLSATPKIEYSGDIDGIPCKVQYVYTKEMISRGWIYNTRVEVSTTFEYTVCRYDTCLKTPDPVLSQKKEKIDDLKTALIESLKRNRKFASSEI